MGSSFRLWGMTAAYVSNFAMRSLREATPASTECNRSAPIDGNFTTPPTELTHSP